MALAGNPYVGPRTFGSDQADRFFGREREARDLLSLVISQRLVLFYAQSGAGKSSLLRARLIPSLRQEGFAVLPVGRVSGELPPGITQVSNLFLYNLMTSIDQGRDGRGGDPSRLQNIAFEDFLVRLTSDDGKTWYFDPDMVVGATLAGAAPAGAVPAGAVYNEPNYVLIVDQFEEILTTHEELVEQRRDFFALLDAAMRHDPKLWVLLTLREDHVAALDPYAPAMADQMRARFYMQRMGADAALDAIRLPAHLGGRDFAPGVAEELRDRLCQVRVPGQEGTTVGPYVEPVQLQVVCYQFWEKLKDRPPGQITREALEELGNVERALGDYYEQVLADVLAEPGIGVSEGELREWFSTRLITAGGTRGFAPQIGDYTAGLPNTVVRLLADRFLIRRETRAGGIWYELVHDTFVPPILRSNREWSQRQSLPVIESFTVAPKIVTRGVQVTVCWQVKNADTLRLEPVGLTLDGGQGEVQFAPDETTAFRLSASAHGLPPVLSAVQNIAVNDPADLSRMAGFVRSQDITLLIGPDLDRRFFFPDGQAGMDALAANTGDDDPLLARRRYLDALIESLRRRHGAGQDAPPPEEMTVSEAAVAWGAFDGATSYAALLRDLAASLPVSVYVTASYHTLLEATLRQLGRQPVTDICRWSDAMAPLLPDLELPPDYEPTAAAPLVYHLYGIDADPRSLVLTEDDYLAFLTGLAGQPDRVPIAVRYALAARFGAVLGFDQDEWAFKALYHGLLNRVDRLRWDYGGLWQIDTRVERGDLEVRSLQSIARRVGLKIFWGRPDDLAHSLQEEWRRR